MTPAMQPRAATAVSLVMLALGAALWARHALVEPAGLTATCDAAPWQDTLCTLRSLVVQGFVQQRLGLLALLLALVAVATRWRWAAWPALASGSAALVLYCADIAAPAVLLAALVCVRPAPSAGP